MSRKRKRPGRGSRRPVRPSVPASDCDADWVSVDGRLMFVAGYTPGGVPFGIFEDEMGDSGTGERADDDPPF